VARDWLLITVSTPAGGSSTLRVYAWRNLRSLGAHYLQQSVCLLPATPKTTRAVTRLVTRLRAEGGHGEMLRISLTDSRQEAAVIDAIQRERTDEHREVVGSTQQFHEELQLERRRGRAMYTEPEESDADLARHQKWLAAIRVARLLRSARRRGGRRRRRVVRGGARPIRERGAVRGARRARVGRRPGLRAVDGADGRQAVGVVRPSAALGIAVGQADEPGPCEPASNSALDAPGGRW
jgi:hypothetical protein